MELATGQPFPALTARYLTRPLRMRASGWSVGDVDFARHARPYQAPAVPLPHYWLTTYPDSGFISSVADMSRYLRELIRGYQGQGTVLRPASYRDHFRPQLAANNFEERNERNPFSESYNVGVFLGFNYTGYTGRPYRQRPRRGDAAVF